MSLLAGVLITLQLTVFLTGITVSLARANLGFVNIMKSIWIGFLAPIIVADLVIDLFKKEFTEE